MNTKIPSADQSCVRNVMLCYVTFSTLTNGKILEVTEFSAGFDFHVTVYRG